MSAITGRLAEIEGLVAQIERRVSEIETEVAGLCNGFTLSDMAKKLAELEGVWRVMRQSERIRVINSTLQVLIRNAQG